MDTRFWRLPTAPTGQQKKQSIHVLHKPDIFSRLPHALDSARAHVYMAAGLHARHPRPPQRLPR